MRLIDADAAIDAFEMNCYPIRYDHNSIEKGMTITGIKQVLDELSPAQPEPRTAYWTKDAVGSIVCSKCGGIRKDNRIGHTNFCNCCGAKMKGEQDANNF